MEEVPGRGMDGPARSRDRLGVNGAASAAGTVGGVTESRSRDRIGASGAAPAVGMLCLGCWSGWEAEEAREVPPLGLSWAVLRKLIIR